MKYGTVRDKQVITITVAGFKLNNELKLSLNWDADLDDWKQAFKTILIHQTFDEDTVKELFENYEEEIPNYDYNNTDSLNNFTYCSNTDQVSYKGSMDNCSDNILYSCEPRR